MNTENIVISNTRRIIREKGLRQNFVAERAGMDGKLFSALLNGRKIIRAEHLAAISTALDIEPGELFREGGNAASEGATM